VVFLSKVPAQLQGDARHTPPGEVTMRKMCAS